MVEQVGAFRRRGQASVVWCSLAALASRLRWMRTRDAPVVHRSPGSTSLAVEEEFTYQFQATFCFHIPRSPMALMNS
uniref:Uncharacterized protein n=1 Tax=Oryza rufipogon TaxID=4529 RepID=A0A0E0N3R3_ORYRU